MASSVPNNVLDWLHSSLRNEYRNVERTYSDVVKTLSAYSSLSPMTDVYTYENGQPALLLVLQGTLPVDFRGTTYRFPIALWVPQAYPYEPPMTYVKPNADMAVRSGQHVGTEGRVYHPYLAQWASHWDKSSILDFLVVLRDVFAKEPPVVARRQPAAQAKSPPRAQTMPTSPTSPRQPTEGQYNPLPQQIRPPPPPPKPPEIAGEGSRASPANAHPSGSLAPPRPPKQGTGTMQGIDMRLQNGHAIAPHSRSSTMPMSGRRPEDGPPPPPLPQEVEGSQPRPGYEYDYNRSPRSQYPSSQPQYFAPPSNAPPPAVQHAFQGQSYQSTQRIQSPPFQQPPPQHQLPPLQQQPPPPQPKPPVQDLMSTALDVTLPSQSTSASLPPPPIPRNPEKDALLDAISSSLVSQHSQTITQNASALPALQAQYEALRAAHAKMTSEMDQLRQLDGLLAANERILHESMRAADRAMESVGRREVPGVDEVLVAPTVVGEQLYGLVAEERSLGDAMFALTRALDKGRVGSDVFVKQTRSLAREQFLKKALIRKIAEGMGLALDGH